MLVSPTDDGQSRELGGIKPAMGESGRRERQGVKVAPALKFRDHCAELRSS